MFFGSGLSQISTTFVSSLQEKSRPDRSADRYRPTLDGSRGLDRTAAGGLRVHLGNALTPHRYNRWFQKQFSRKEALVYLSLVVVYITVSFLFVKSHLILLPLFPYSFLSFIFMLPNLLINEIKSVTYSNNLFVLLNT